MTTDLSKTFKQMVTDAGLPTTESEARIKWEAEATAVASPYNNNSAQSPFWRVILALVTAPVLWIVNDLVLLQLLPNFFLQTAKSQFLDLFGWAVDLPRKQSAKARGNLIFSRVSAVGEVIIPIGVVVQSPVINGKIYHMVTLAAATMADGVSSVTVAAEAAEDGAGYNLPSGFYAVMPDPPAGITGVTNDSNWLTSAGTSEEKDDDYRLRIRNQYGAITQYHTDSVYTKIVTSFANINTRNVYFEHDAPRGPGTANIYILMDIGEPSTQLLEDIQSHIMDEGNHGHGDDLQVFAMPGTDYDLVVTIRAVISATTEEVDSLLLNVQDAVSAAFRQNDQYTMTVTQPWSTFAFSRLAGELHELFPLLESVTFDLAEITSELEIPRLGTLDVVLDV